MGFLKFTSIDSELLQIREALQILIAKLKALAVGLGDFAFSHRSQPCLGFTHFQPAQPVTVGKRTSLWAQDVVMALEQVTWVADTALKFRGIKGATGCPNRTRFAGLQQYSANFRAYYFH